MSADPYRIVVVATRPMERFLALALRVVGYEPWALTDGSQALKYLLSEPVDALVMDAALPMLDGFAVCARLRAVSAIPIVLLLYRDEAHRRAEALAKGATACLVHPVGVEELLVCIRSVLPSPPDATNSDL